MPGYIVSNMKNTPDLSTISAPNRIYKKAQIGDVSVQTSTLKKFENDKVFAPVDNDFIVTEGLLLNSKSLYGVSTGAKESNLALEAKLATGIKEFGTEFFSTLYGSYSGAFYNSATGEWTVWTNHTGDSAVFVYFDDATGCFAVGTQFDYVVDTLKASGVNVTLDEASAYSLLTYAFMCDEGTLAKEIKRLFPGTCMIINPAAKTARIETYWTLTNNKFNLKNVPEHALIDEIDRLFREGIALEFEKDKEYGYKHLANLSGGFDARMVNFVAKDMGYEPILNTHYSQSKSLEQKLSRKLAKVLGHDIIVHELDDIEFMYDIDALSKMNYCLAIYSGSTGGKKMLESIDFNEYGIEHTGMIGDVVIGTFMNDPDLGKDDPLQYLYSDKIKDRLTLDHIARYPSLEIQYMYIRAILGACTSYQIRKYYTEPISVFMYPPLLDYCMSIPVELRRNHSLYFKWILAKYPDAASVPWDHLDAKITTPAKVAKIKHYIKRLPAKVLSKLHLKADNYGMNPHQYWYDTKPEFREFLDKYFEENINKPIYSDELRKDMSYVFTTGNPIEKLQVLTVLAAGNNYFS